MKTAVVANPRSAKGRTEKRWSVVRRRLEDRLGPIEVRFTEREGHAVELARELLLEGFDRIIGVGGDGTYNEIANGFVRDDKPVRPGACLALMPMGTGGDFRRTPEIPTNLDRMIDALTDSVPLEIDLGKISYVDHSGEPGSRYFINVVSLGIGGEVCSRAKNFLSPLGGQAAFFYATLQGFMVYRSKHIDLYLEDSQQAVGCKVLNVVAGNGMYHGGGMYVCPRASLNDGLLDVTVIEHLSLPTMLRDIRYLYNGNIHEYPKIRHYRVRKVRATAPEPVKIEVDGEALGQLPVDICVVPRAMHILVPKNSRVLGPGERPAYQ